MFVRVRAVREKREVVPVGAAVLRLPDVRASRTGHVDGIPVGRGDCGVVPALPAERGTLIVLHQDRDREHGPGLAAIDGLANRLQSGVVGRADTADGEGHGGIDRRSPPELGGVHLNGELNAAVVRKQRSIGEATAQPGPRRKESAAAIIRHGRSARGRAGVALEPGGLGRPRGLRTEHARVVTAELKTNACNTIVRSLRWQPCAELLRERSVQHGYWVRWEAVRLRRIGIVVNDREIGPSHILLRELHAIVVVRPRRVRRENGERCLALLSRPVIRGGAREVRPRGAVVPPDARRAGRGGVHLVVARSHVNRERQQSAVGERERRLNGDLRDRLPVQRVRAARAGDQRPGAARVLRVVDAGAGVRIARVVGFARAVVNVRGVRGVHRDGSTPERCRLRAQIEERQPRVPAVFRLPRTAARRRDVDHVRIGRIDGRARHAPRHRQRARRLPVVDRGPAHFQPANRDVRRSRSGVRPRARHAQGFARDREVALDLQLGVARNDGARTRGAIAEAEGLTVRGRDDAFIDERDAAIGVRSAEHEFAVAALGELRAAEGVQRIVDRRQHREAGVGIRTESRAGCERDRPAPGVVGRDVDDGRLPVRDLDFGPAEDGG